jgi:hypothetical protein
MSPRASIVRAILAGGCLLALASTLYAIKISLFVDTDSLIERCSDIVIVEVTGASVENTNRYDDGFYAVDVDVIMALKGNKAKGQTKLATIYPVEHGQRYLVSSLGGSAFGTDLLAVPELSLVRLPSELKLESLEGKPLKEQVTLIFKKRLEDVVREQAVLAHERTLLERATGIKHDESNKEN